MLNKPIKIRSNKIRQSARGEDCCLRIPGICNGNPETTIFAHLPGSGNGMGTKSNDIHGVYACSSCHDWLDRRVKSDLEEWLNRHEQALRALIETQIRIYEKGLIKVDL